MKKIISSVFTIILFLSVIQTCFSENSRNIVVKVDVYNDYYNGGAGLVQGLFEAMLIKNGFSVANRSTISSSVEEIDYTSNPYYNANAGGSNKGNFIISNVIVEIYYDYKFIDGGDSNWSINPGNIINRYSNVNIPNVGYNSYSSSQRVEVTCKYRLILIESNEVTDLQISQGNCESNCDNQNFYIDGISYNRTKYDYHEKAIEKATLQSLGPILSNLQSIKSKFSDTYYVSNPTVKKISPPVCTDTTGQTQTIQLGNNQHSNPNTHYMSSGTINFDDLNEGDYVVIDASGIIQILNASFIDISSKELNFANSLSWSSNNGNLNKNINIPKDIQNYQALVTYSVTKNGQRLVKNIHYIYP